MSRKPRRFSIGWFIVGIALQVLAAVYLVKTFLPDIWEHQMRTSFEAKFGVYTGMRVYMCYFEWFFHRYVLHRIVVPFLAHMARAHRMHHAVCFIREMFDRDRNGKFIINRYPIETAEQFPNASFPIYATAGFCLFFTPLLWALQQLLPNLPIYFGGYAAIIHAASDYEILHALQHYPFRYWKWLTSNPVSGPFARMIYGHHELHHFIPEYNDNIAGVCLGIPLADLTNGTRCRPINLLLHDHERIATIDDYVEPKPRAWVKWLDKKAVAIESYITHRKAA